MAQVGPGLCIKCKVKPRPKRSDRKNAWRSICWGCAEKTRPNRKKVTTKQRFPKIHKRPFSLICDICNIKPKIKRTDRENSYRIYCSSCAAKVYYTNLDKNSDVYISRLIKSNGYTGEITKELIETKRLSLMLFRALKKV